MLLATGLSFGPAQWGFALEVDFGCEGFGPGSSFFGVFKPKQGAGK
jgi:hypothetical protein